MNHLDIGAGYGPLATTWELGNDRRPRFIYWYSDQFGPAPSWVGGPELKVLEEKIVDDLGNTYHLDDIKAKAMQPYDRGHGAGFAFKFIIAEAKIAPEAKELSVELVVFAYGRKFHMTDRVLKDRHRKDKWASERRVLKLDQTEKAQPPG